MKSGKTIIALTAAFVMCLFFVGNVTAAEPIKMGAILPLGDITGAQASKAMKLAVKELNEQGGLLGRPVELAVVDSEFRPEKGAAAVEKLVTVDKVDVLLGGMSSGVHMGQIPVLKKYKKVTVWIGAAYHGCEEAMKGQDWYFHLHPWDYLQGASYAEGWNALEEKYPEVSIQKQFWAYEEGAFGSGSYKASSTLWPDREIRGESFKSAAHGGGDYRTILRHAKQFGPDIFFWVGYGADALPIMEQAKEVNFSPPIFLGSPPGWPPDFGKSSLAEAVTLYGMWAPSIKEVSTVSRHFWEEYNKMYKDPPATYFAPLGYTNVMFVAEGIKKAGTVEKDALIKALEEVEYPSPCGEVLKIAPSNVIKHQGFRRQKILQWQDGKQVVLWPFQFATAKIDHPFPSWEGR